MRAAEVYLVHTGQHYDADMSDIFFASMNSGFVPPITGWPLVPVRIEQTARLMTALEPIIAELRPDGVAVVGDVTSTLAAALVTAKSPALLGDVEAGLRSGDWTMPEEVNRVVTDRVSDYLFAPSSDAVENLRAEGLAPERIHLVGNVMIDTLLANVGRARRSLEARTAVSGLRVSAEVIP